MSNTKRKIGTKALLLRLAVLFGLAVPSSAMAIHVAPKEMLVGTTYNGKDVQVTGTIGADEDVVVQVVGNSSEAEFKQNGKVGGIFWMTVAHLAIADAPSAYFVYLPKAISTLRQTGDERWYRLQFDYGALLPDIKIVPEPKDKADVFKDFLQLKEHDGLYQVIDDGVTYAAGQNGEKQFQARIHIPAKMPIASYEVKVTRLKDGQITGREEDHFTLKEAGFPLLISTLAFNHSLLYGVLAVVIAILAGLFMGVLFQQRGGGAH